MDSFYSKYDSSKCVLFVYEIMSFGMVVYTFYEHLHIPVLISFQLQNAFHTKNKYFVSKNTGRNSEGVNPLSTASPFWRQTTQELRGMSSKRDCNLPSKG